VGSLHPIHPLTLVADTTAPCVLQLGQCSLICNSAHGCAAQGAIIQCISNGAQAAPIPSQPLPLSWYLNLHCRTKQGQPAATVPHAAAVPLLGCLLQVTHNLAAAQKAQGMVVQLPQHGCWQWGAAEAKPDPGRGETEAQGREDKVLLLRTTKVARLKPLLAMKGAGLSVALP
jgi:hypothetical protein